MTPHTNHYPSLFNQACNALLQENYHQAFELFSIGAQNQQSECYNNLAVLYESGLGTKTDFRLALFWYKKAWRCEPSSGVCCNIAGLYAKTENIRQARFWWNKAIVQFQDGDAAIEYATFLLNKSHNKYSRKIIRLLDFAQSTDYITEEARKQCILLIRQCMDQVSMPDPQGQNDK